MFEDLRAFSKKPYIFKHCAFEVEKLNKFYHYFSIL